MDMYTLLYLKWINNKDLLQSARSFAQLLCGSLDGRVFWRNGYMCMYGGVTLLFT